MPMGEASRVHTLSKCLANVDEHHCAWYREDGLREFEVGLSYIAVTPRMGECKGNP